MAEERVMVYQLQVNEFQKAGEVFSRMENHLAVAAILDGSAPGRVYVDDPARPASALARGARRFYLAGDAGNPNFNESLRRLFGDEIYPQAQREGAAACMLYYPEASWEAPAEQILEGKKPVKLGRQYYELKALRQDWRKLIPPGMVVRRVDAKLLEDTQLKHLDDLKNEMVSECPSLETFLHTRLGVCALAGDEIAGWSLSEYNLGERCEIGIETVGQFRRQGVGTITAGALIELAQAQGIRRIGWDCFSENAPSAATAVKVGFEMVEEYSVYFTWVTR